MAFEACGADVAVAVADAGPFFRTGVRRRVHRARLIGSDARLLRRPPSSGPGDRRPFRSGGAGYRRAAWPNAWRPAGDCPTRADPGLDQQRKGHVPLGSLLPDRLPLCAPDRRIAAAAGQRSSEDGNCAGRRRGCRPAAGRRGVPRLAAACAPADAKGTAGAAGADGSRTRRVRLDHGLRHFLVGTRPPADHSDDVGPEGELRLQWLHAGLCAQPADGRCLKTAGLLRGGGRKHRRLPGGERARPTSPTSSS